MALVAFSARAADITGEWRATVDQSDHTYEFRQNAGRFIGTVRSPDGVLRIANGYINHNRITFTTSVSVDGRRDVLEYTGDLVSDTEIRFERKTAGIPYPIVEFVATRVGAP